MTAKVIKTKKRGDWGPIVRVTETHSGRLTERLTSANMQLGDADVLSGRPGFQAPSCTRSLFSRTSPCAGGLGNVAQSVGHNTSGSTGKLKHGRHCLQPGFPSRRSHEDDAGEFVQWGHPGAKDF